MPDNHVDYSTPNVHLYNSNGFTMQDINNIASQVDAASRNYEFNDILARYGHLLPEEHQQHLGYVASVTAQADGSEVHTVRYQGTGLRDAFLIQPEVMDSAFAYAFGETRLRKKPKDALVPPLGPTEQELTASAEWLKTSPWA